MDEAYFWESLEFRLCRELAGLPERRYQHFWCDGITPNEYLLDGPAPRITGRCWICNDAAQATWEFALLLPGPVASREEIDWASLHPADHVTGWMSFDEGRQYLEMEPSAAVTELAEAEKAPDRRSTEPVPDALGAAEVSRRRPEDVLLVREKHPSRVEHYVILVRPQPGGPWGYEVWEDEESYRKTIRQLRANGVRITGEYPEARLAPPADI